MSLDRPVKDVTGSYPNPCLETAFTAGGGHVGFVTGPPWAPRFWAEERVAEYIRTRLHY
jgi:predicted alpha/beta-fold hydrolase